MEEETEDKRRKVIYLGSSGGTNIWLNEHRSNSRRTKRVRYEFMRGVPTPADDHVVEHIYQLIDKGEKWQVVP